jgi:glycosyltransferase involved in cell wall biosynthesis
MLSERICELIENEALRKKMGAAAQENASEYAIESIIRQWMDLFHQVSGEREARHRN